MPAYLGGVIAFCIFLAFFIGLLSGYVMFSKTKDENYYAGYNDGLDKAYNLRRLYQIMSYAKENPAKITPWRRSDFLVG